ncbi:hypothetical protein R1sor_021371 [Riccia sorocarpa]|uniref:Molybdenum cofactor sulfurase n=1 Tax=Riccia sorocarpa TaxID=122646 RepID=A0ABD3GK82_9MARC
MPSFQRKLQHARDHEPPPVVKPGSPLTDRSSSVSFSSSRRISRSSQARVEARREFLKVTSKGFRGEFFTNLESLPPLDAAYNIFLRMYPKFTETWAIDDLREREYCQLVEDEHVCMDYCGFGLFFFQQVINKASSFRLAYVPASLPTQALYGAAEEGIAEAYMRKRVMDYLNVSEQEYSMVFTVSRGSAFKVLAESYPFHLCKRLLTVYDFESEAVNCMAECAKLKGAKVMRASFKWPTLRLNSSELKKQLQVKKRKGGSAKGLFVFPVQSRMTGAKYSYQWMSQAQQNRWHVLLDVSALGPKDMDSLGLSLFRPDFIVSSFYKVFGTDPSGFGCIFIKNSVLQSLQNSSRSRCVGLVRIISGSYSPTTGAQSRNSEEEEEAQPTPWEVDQQVGMISSFSGPVSSFFSETSRKKLKSSINGERQNFPAARFPTAGEIQEDFGGYGDSGRFRGQVNGFHRQSGGVMEDSRGSFDLDPTNSAERYKEAEEVFKSGSLIWPRSSLGSNSGEVEEVIENKPRKSLSELFLERDASPIGPAADIFHENDELPTTSSRFHFSPSRRSFRGADTVNHRRAGDDSGDGEYEDFVIPQDNYRNELIRDPDPSDIMYSRSIFESRFESQPGETRNIEKEIEEKEFSRTALSDIEEEKGEGKAEEDDDEWHRKVDDHRRTEQSSGVFPYFRGLVTGGSQAGARDNAERSPRKRAKMARQEMETGKRKVEPQAVAQNKDVKAADGFKAGIKARIVKFMGKFSFRKNCKKERSDSQISGAEGHEFSSQFEGVQQRNSVLLGEVLQPNSKLTPELVPGADEQRETRSSVEELPKTKSPMVEQVVEGRKSYGGSSNEAFESPESRARSSVSGPDGAGEFFDPSHELSNGDRDWSRVVRTPNSATNESQPEPSVTGELSFDEDEFHDAQSHRGINGFSQDLSSGRTMSRDVEVDDNILIPAGRRFALRDDVASFNLGGSDEDSYYRGQQYCSDYSYHESSSPRSFAEDSSISGDGEGLSDDEFLMEDYGDVRQCGIVCKGLDLADSLGLSRTNDRLRYLINWLVNSLIKLHHPGANSRGNPLVRIYGPKVKYDRGAGVAFNLFDWKGMVIEPSVVQALADRSNIALRVGRLCNIVDPDLTPEFLAEKERWCDLEKSDHVKEGTRSCVGRRSDGGRSSSAGKCDSLSIPVVTAALSFVTNFEDVYKLWALVAKFLDADFVSKEVWKYHPSNQQTVTM